MLDFTKISPAVAELFHADGQKHMKLIMAFRNFTVAPEKVCVIYDVARRRFFTLILLSCPKFCLSLIQIKFVWNTVMGVCMN